MKAPVSLHRVPGSKTYRLVRVHKHSNRSLGPEEDTASPKEEVGVEVQTLSYFSWT